MLCPCRIKVFLPPKILLPPIFNHYQHIINQNASLPTQPIQPAPAPLHHHQCIPRTRRLCGLPSFQHPLLARNSRIRRDTSAAAISHRLLLPFHASGTAESCWKRLELSQYCPLRLSQGNKLFGLDFHHDCAFSGWVLFLVSGSRLG